MKTLKALFVLIAVFIIVYEIANMSSDSKHETDKSSFNEGINTSYNNVKTDKDVDIDTGNEGDNKTVIDEQFEENETQEEKDRELSNETYELEGDLSTLSNEKQAWSFKRNSNNEPVLGYTKSNLSKYGAYYIVNTNEKVMYLTFDEGYEYGYTETILDILKENNVQAVFFVTLPYIRENKDLVIRMKEEGHLIGNHSDTHRSFPELSDEEVIQELRKTAKYFKEETGYEMDPFFRPPMGEYSERTLHLAREEGYRTIFWSIAYMDWDVNNQPGKEFVYNHFMENNHPGAIPLVHAVSSSNAEALDDVLKAMIKGGYRFGSLYEIE